MRRPGDVDAPLRAVCAAAAVVGALAVAAAVMGGFGVAGFVGWMRADPAEFPTCRGRPPQPGEPVVRSGDCYTSAAFPLDNDTLFCAAPTPGETLRWASGCVDTYAPPALTSLGSPAVLANATALRGIRGGGLLAVVETPTHLNATVPLPTSAGGVSLVADAANNVFAGLAGTGLVSVNPGAGYVELGAPQPTSAGGATLVADAANNVFLGLEAAGSVQIAGGAGSLVVRDVPWERGEVGAIGVENVDAFVGETLYSRLYTLDNREHGEARGAIYVRYTDAGRLTVLQLDLRVVAPIGSGTGWIGPGAVGCVYKDFRAGSIATTIFAAAAFSHDDGRPYLWFMSPADFGGGVTIECTFEMAYMFEL